MKPCNYLEVPIGIHDENSRVAGWINEHKNESDTVIKGASSRLCRLNFTVNLHGWRPHIEGLTISPPEDNDGISFRNNMEILARDLWIEPQMNAWAVRAVVDNEGSNDGEFDPSWPTIGNTNGGKQGARTCFANFENVHIRAKTRYNGLVNGHGWFLENQIDPQVPRQYIGNIVLDRCTTIVGGTFMYTRRVGQTYLTNTTAYVNGTGEEGAGRGLVIDDPWGRIIWRGGFIEPGSIAKKARSPIIEGDDSMLDVTDWPQHWQDWPRK